MLTIPVLAFACQGGKGIDLFFFIRQTMRSQGVSENGDGTAIMSSNYVTIAR